MPCQSLLRDPIGLQRLIVNFKYFTNNQLGPFIVDLNVKSELFSIQGAMQNLRTEPRVNEMHATLKSPMGNSAVSVNWANYVGQHANRLYSMFILCIKPFLIQPTISIHEHAWSDIGINSNNNRHYSNSMLITLAAISACWMHASGSVWWLLINFHSTRIVLFKSTAQTVSGLFEQLHVCHHFIIHFAVTIANHKQIQSKSLLTPSAFLSGLLTMMLITCLCIPELLSTHPPIMQIFVSRIDMIQPFFILPDLQPLSEELTSLLCTSYYFQYWIPRPFIYHSSVTHLPLNIMQEWWNLPHFLSLISLAVQIWWGWIFPGDSDRICHFK